MCLINAAQVDLMKNQKLKLCALITTSLMGLLSESCGQEDDVVSLEGSWVSTCHSESDGDGAVGYFTGDLIFSGNSLSWSKTEFSGSLCEAPKMTAILSAGYSVSSKAKKDDVHILDLSITKLEVTVHSSDLVTALNSDLICGDGFFEAETLKVVTSSDCSGFFTFTQGTVRYDIFSETDTGLQFGETDEINNGTSADKRPTGLTSWFFVRK